jgi:hypothetical protein
MMMKARPAAQRLYADFLMPSRLDSFERLLRTIVEAGYTVTSVEAFARQQVNGVSGTPERTLILRHDVDTDPVTARSMWQIEHRLGIVGSFYFRLSTLDAELMAAIAEAGGSASYHYEEIATVAKRRRLRTPAEVEACLPEAQAEFRDNLFRLRALTGLPMEIVASHGDFVNRRIGVPNWRLLVDEAFRRSVGIVAEVYDQALMAPVTSRHSDTLYPRFWVPASPLAAVSQGEPVVYILVHPRHWRAAPAENLRDDLRRVAEGIAHALPRRSR